MVWFLIGLEVCISLVRLVVLSCCVLMSFILLIVVIVWLVILKIVVVWGFGLFVFWICNKKYF